MFKELSGDNSTYKDINNVKVKDLGELGVLAFNFGVTDKNEIRTPHYEFEQIADMIENNPIVSSALNQYVEMLIPNEVVKIQSEDKRSVEFLEKWHSLRPKFLSEIKLLALTEIGFGNGPLQKCRVKAKDGKGVPVLDNVYTYTDMRRIWVNPDDETGEKAYFLQIPIGMNKFWFGGEFKVPMMHNVTYIKNYNYMVKQLWGIWINKEEMALLKTGFSLNNLYGRSVLASGIDAHNVFKEIISSWDTIARTRSLDQTIMTPKDADTAALLNDKAKKNIIETLEDNGSSFKFLPVPIEFGTQHIEVSGKYDLMEGVFDLVRRMLIMSLLPQHLTPWSDTATTQGAEASTPPFIARLKSKQKQLIQFLNENVIGELRKVYTWLDEDATYVFDLPVLDEGKYIDTIINLYEKGFITKLQASDYFEKIGVAEGLDWEQVRKRLKDEEKLLSNIVGEQ